MGLGAAVAAAAFAAFVVAGYGGLGAAARGIFSNPEQGGNAAQRLISLGVGFRADYWKVAWEAWLENPLTGTGAGTFQFTWFEGRPGVQGVKQVHNLYLEQLTETGIFAFFALLAFVVFLVAVIARAAWRRRPEGGAAPPLRPRGGRGGLPDLLRRRVALVPPGRDAVLLRPRRLRRAAGPRGHSPKVANGETADETTLG